MAASTTYEDSCIDLINSIQSDLGEVSPLVSEPGDHTSRGADGFSDSGVGAGFVSASCSSKPVPSVSTTACAKAAGKSLLLAAAATSSNTAASNSSSTAASSSRPSGYGTASSSSSTTPAGDNLPFRNDREQLLPTDGTTSAQGEKVSSKTMRVVVPVKSKLMQLPEQTAGIEENSSSLVGTSCSGSGPAAQETSGANGEPTSVLPDGGGSTFKTSHESGDHEQGAAERPPTSSAGAADPADIIPQFKRVTILSKKKQVIPKAPTGVAPGGAPVVGPPPGPPGGTTAAASPVTTATASSSSCTTLAGAGAPSRAAPAAHMLPPVIPATTRPLVAAVAPKCAAIAATGSSTSSSASSSTVKSIKTKLAATNVHAAAEALGVVVRPGPPVANLNHLNGSGAMLSTMTTAPGHAGQPPAGAAGAHQGRLQQNGGQHVLQSKAAASLVSASANSVVSSLLGGNANGGGGTRVTLNKKSSVTVKNISENVARIVVDEPDDPDKDDDEDELDDDLDDFDSYVPDAAAGASKSSSSNNATATTGAGAEQGAAQTEADLRGAPSESTSDSLSDVEEPALGGGANAVLGNLLFGRLGGGGAPRSSTGSGSGDAPVSVPGAGASSCSSTSIPVPAQQAQQHPAMGNMLQQQQTSSTVGGAGTGMQSAGAGGGPAAPPGTVPVPLPMPQQQQQQQMASGAAPSAQHPPQGGGGNLEASLLAKAQSIHDPNHQMNAAGGSNSATIYGNFNKQSGLAPPGIGYKGVPGVYGYGPAGKRKDDDSGAPVATDPPHNLVPSHQAPGQVQHLSKGQQGAPQFVTGAHSLQVHQQKGSFVTTATQQQQQSLQQIHPQQPLAAGGPPPLQQAPGASPSGTSQAAPTPVDGSTKPPQFGVDANSKGGSNSPPTTYINPAAAQHLQQQQQLVHQLQGGAAPTPTHTQAGAVGTSKGQPLAAQQQQPTTSPAGATTGARQGQAAASANSIKGGQVQMQPGQHPQMAPVGGQPPGQTPLLTHAHSHHPGMPATAGKGIPQAMPQKGAGAPMSMLAPHATIGAPPGVYHPGAVPPGLYGNPAHQHPGLYQQPQHPGHQQHHAPGTILQGPHGPVVAGPHAHHFGYGAPHGMAGATAAAAGGKGPGMMSNPAIGHQPMNPLGAPGGAYPGAGYHPGGAYHGFQTGVYPGQGSAAVTIPPGQGGTGAGGHIKGGWTGRGATEANPYDPSRPVSPQELQKAQEAEAEAARKKARKEEKKARKKKKREVSEEAEGSKDSGSPNKKNGEAGGGDEKKKAVDPAAATAASTETTSTTANDSKAKTSDADAVVPPEEKNTTSPEAAPAGVSSSSSGAAAGVGKNKLEDKAGPSSPDAYEEDKLQEAYAAASSGADRSPSRPPPGDTSKTKTGASTGKTTDDGDGREGGAGPRSEGAVKEKAQKESEKRSKTSPNGARNTGGVNALAGLRSGAALPTLKKKGAPATKGGGQGSRNAGTTSSGTTVENSSSSKAGPAPEAGINAAASSSSSSSGGRPDPPHPGPSEERDADTKKNKNNKRKAPAVSDIAIANKERDGQLRTRDRDQADDRQRGRSQQPNRGKSAYRSRSLHPNRGGKNGRDRDDRRTGEDNAAATSSRGKSLAPTRALSGKNPRTAGGAGASPSCRERQNQSASAASAASSRDDNENDGAKRRRRNGGSPAPQNDRGANQGASSSGADAQQREKDQNAKDLARYASKLENDNDRVHLDVLHGRFSACSGLHGKLLDMHKVLSAYNPELTVAALWFSISVKDRKTLKETVPEIARLAPKLESLCETTREGQLQGTSSSGSSSAAGHPQASGRAASSSATSSGNKRHQSQLRQRDQPASDPNSDDSAVSRPGDANKAGDKCADGTSSSSTMIPKPNLLATVGNRPRRVYAPGNSAPASGQSGEAGASARYVNGGQAISPATHQSRRSRSRGREQARRRSRSRSPGRERSGANNGRDNDAGLTNKNNYRNVSQVRGRVVLMPGPGRAGGNYGKDSKNNRTRGGRNCSDRERDVERSPRNGGGGRTNYTGRGTSGRYN